MAIGTDQDRDDEGARAGRAPPRHRGVIAEPTRAPTAADVSSRPKPDSDSPIGPGSTMNSGMTANWAVKARFISPTQRARVRRIRWPARYRTPSTMSRRIVGGPLPRSGRNEPCSASRTTAASVYAPALVHRARASSRGDEHAAERRADELVRRQLHGVEPAVGAGESVGGHDRRHDRLGRGVEQRLADPEGERHDVEQPELLVARWRRERRGRRSGPPDRHRRGPSSDAGRAGRRARRRAARTAARAGGRRR